MKWKNFIISENHEGTSLQPYLNYYIFSMIFIKTPTHTSSLIYRKKVIENITKKNKFFQSKEETLGKVLQEI